MKNTNTTVGTHIVGELFSCDNEKILTRGDVETILLRASRAAGFTVLHQYFYQFSPQGVTGVLVLSSSHIAVHTWPEYDYVAVDVFHCGPAEETQKAFDVIASAFGAKRVHQSAIVRGVRGLPQFDAVASNVPAKTAAQALAK